MPLFEKVIAESVDQPGDLKDILGKKLRDKKLQEMDETTIERQVQAEQTKTAELAARQTEAEVRKTTAELSIADKVVPQGLWAVIAELLKDRNPNQPMTVQDMMKIMEFARSQQGEGAAEGPPDGMWGFLTAIMTNMNSHNQTTTPLELIQLIQSVSSMGQPQQPQPQNPVDQMVTIAQAFATMKSIFSPPQQQFPSGSQVTMPGGGVLTLEELKDFQNHSFNLEMRKIDHDEKVKNFQTARQVAPGVIPAITELAQALRKGGMPDQNQKRKQIDTQQREQLPSPRNQQGDFQLVQCPDCNLQFGVPAELDIEKVDITCPACAVVALNLKGETDAQKPTEDNSQKQSAVGQGEDQGSDKHYAQE